MKTFLSNLEGPSVYRFSRSPLLLGVLLLGLSTFLGFSAPATAVETAVAAEEAGFARAILIAVLAALVMSVLIVVGLILWSRKQEHIYDMTLFCMKYLIHSEEESGRCDSARALGTLDDPGALLVLANITWDDEEPEAVRKAAGEALHEMSGRFRKYKKIVTNLESAAEEPDFRRIIEILMDNFEKGEKRTVQSAYVIGRHYMRLGLYAEGRDWLEKAKYRNRKFNLYGDRIERWIDLCNTHLLREANDLFKAADYQKAREHYAVLAHGLSDADRRRWALYLRSACVYCKLEDYRNADQALLQALEHTHETDLALPLAPLLQDIFARGEGTDAEPEENLEQTKRAIDERASATMKVLLARKPSEQTT